MRISLGDELDASYRGCSIDFRIGTIEWEAEKGAVHGQPELSIECRVFVFILFGNWIVSEFPQSEHTVTFLLPPRSTSDPFCFFPMHRR